MPAAVNLIVTVLSTLPALIVVPVDILAIPEPSATFVTSTSTLPALRWREAGDALNSAIISTVSAFGWIIPSEYTTSMWPPLGNVTLLTVTVRPTPMLSFLIGPSPSAAVTVPSPSTSIDAVTSPGLTLSASTAIDGVHPSGIRNDSVPSLIAVSTASNRNVIDCVLAAGYSASSMRSSSVIVVSPVSGTQTLNVTSLFLFLIA